MPFPNPDTQFEKGKSGNPNGRPKLPDISEALQAVLNEEKDGIKALDAVLKALRTKAIKGDVRAIQELLDRAYGKSKQSVDHTTLGEKLPAMNVEIITPNASQ